MVKFKWDDSYLVGNEEIDNQHKFMFEFGNDIIDVDPVKMRVCILNLHNHAE